MTESATMSPPTRRLRWWQAYGAWLLGGLSWGILARAWMRLISTQPEFTWSGTIFILTVATLIAAFLGLPMLLRRRPGTRRARSAPAVGALAIFPLGMGPGAVMLPAIIGGALALHGREVNGKIARALLTLVAFGAVLLVGRTGTVSIPLVGAIALVVVLVIPRAGVTVAAAILALGAVGLVIRDLFGGGLPAWRSVAGALGYLLLVGLALAAYGTALTGRTALRLRRQPPTVDSRKAEM